MPEILTTGLSIVLLAGVFQGSCLVFAKWTRGWAWENYWLIFSLFAYLICPWALALATVPHLGQVYAGAGGAALFWALLFGVGWGLGALTFGLGVEAVGLALGYAVILGVAATSGTLVPLIVNPPENFSWQVGAVTGLALAIMLIGVAVCSAAGRWKEKPVHEGGRSYRRGVLICVASGLLSACGNFGFAFGAGLAERARALGASPESAGNVLWALLTIPVFLCNAGYAVRLLRRNRTAVSFRKSPAWNGLMGMIMGVTWLAGMATYGAGAGRLGALGTSLGWAILMSTMVLVANALGILTGEWNGAPRQSRRQLGAGVAILLLAIAVLGYANHLRAAG
ncbi:MAG TPA: L-rhamnose/proton symporter RhaT [Bryobacteraceae bacterium]|nr:L-rhamnose/proton symporter RhaT [Bryobacteraceae bacterium]